MLKKSIEDWMLYDLDGICKFLKIKNPPKLDGKNGIEKMNKLFKSKNKPYIKGKKLKGLVNSLDMRKIASVVCREIKPLCFKIGIECDEKKCK